MFLPGYKSKHSAVLQDVNADSYQRAYHRILVPLNASSSQGLASQWYVTVANLNGQALNGLEVAQYYIRVSCVSPSTLNLCPDPRPDLNSSLPCSANGVCSDPPANTMRPALNKVCTCNTGYGDYGCNRKVSEIIINADQKADLTVPSGQWTFLQFKVPKPGTGVTKPTLLVEMNKTPGGGDPVLVVKPKDVGARAVPWFTDINDYADLRSYFLLQNYHYDYMRNLPEDGAAYYIGVYNNERRFSSNAPLDRTARVTVNVRYRPADSGSSYDKGLCPLDCSGSGRGTCYDPWDVRSSGMLPTPILPPLNPSQSMDFMCACKSGYGGTFCEGNLRNLTLGSGTDIVAPSSPAQWDYYLIKPTPQNFKFASDVITIDWRITDPKIAGIQFYNMYLTIDEHAFPRDAQFDSVDPFRRGWQLYYHALAAKSDPPAPLQIKGSELKNGLTYVLGVYNNDYLKSQAVQYSLNVYVPSHGSTWLHPYMSVVLGVTASIILCLFMTLCKRFLQRHGLGPWRNQRLAVNAQGTPVVAIAPRPAGVPAHIISGFRTYEYGATKAEKAQLQKSKRAAVEHQSSALPPGTPDEQAEGADAVEALQPASRTNSTTRTSANVPGRLNRANSKRPTSAVASAPALPPVEGEAAAAVAAGTTAAVVAASAAEPADPLRAPAAIGSSSSSGGSPPAHGADDDDEPQCTVCLCEYEEGERITQLPCQHEFHSMCINKWMQTHNTCPICRIALVPEEAPADAAAAARVAANGHAHPHSHGQPNSIAGPSGHMPNGTGAVPSGNNQLVLIPVGSASATANAVAGGGGVAPPPGPPPSGSGFMGRWWNRVPNGHAAAPGQVAPVNGMPTDAAGDGISNLPPGSPTPSGFGRPGSGDTAASVRNVSLAVPPAESHSPVPSRLGSPVGNLAAGRTATPPAQPAELIAAPVPPHGRHSGSNGGAAAVEMQPPRPAPQ